MSLSQSATTAASTLVVTEWVERGVLFLTGLSRTTPQFKRTERTGKMEMESPFQVMVWEGARALTPIGHSPTKKRKNQFQLTRKNSQTLQHRNPRFAVSATKTRSAVVGSF